MRGGAQGANPASSSSPASVVIDGAAATGCFTGKCEDAWTRDKRELVNIS